MQIRLQPQKVANIRKSLQTNLLNYVEVVMAKRKRQAHKIQKGI